MSVRHTLGISAYRISWIASLPVEIAAATAMLDERHDNPLGFVQAESDTNAYTWGSINGHNIVITSFLTGVYGVSSITSTISGLTLSWPHIHVHLLVGIGAGVPTNGRNIRLGDVAVGQSGVIQFQFDKSKIIARDDGWKWRLAPKPFLTGLADLQAEHELQDSQISDILQKAGHRYPQWALKFGYPGSQYDQFGGTNNSDREQELEREKRSSNAPRIHYGSIGSSNALIENAATRQSITAALGSDCICLETTAAGLSSDFPCLVVRGICDYADGRGDQRWQRYASATAAAYVKELLSIIPKKEVVKLSIKISQRLDPDAWSEQTPGLESVKKRNENIVSLLRSLYRAPYAERKYEIPDRVPGTCEWFTQHRLVKRWLGEEKAAPNTLLVTGDPGTGKSVLAKYLVDQQLPDPGRSICYFFFKKDSPDQNNAAAIGSAFLRQILICHPNVLTNTLINELNAEADGGYKSFSRLWGIFTGLDRMITGQVVCVIDALDECIDDEDRAEVIHTICGSGGVSEVKVLVFSRPDFVIQRHFDDLSQQIPILQLSEMSEAENVQEIDLVIHNRVSELAAQRSLTSEQQAILEKAFLSAPVKTYSWVNLVLTMLEDPPELAKNLASMPHLLTERIRSLQSDHTAMISELSPSSSGEVFSKLTKQMHSITTATQPTPSADKKTNHQINDNKVSKPAYTIGPRSVLMSQDDVEVIAQNMAEKISRLNKINLSAEQASSLCYLLQEFALRFGHDEKVSMGFEQDRDRGRIMKFVHQEAQNIVAAFGRIIARDPQRGMTPREKMDIFFSGLADLSEVIPHDEPLPEPLEHQEDERRDIEAIEDDQGANKGNVARPSIDIDFDRVDKSPDFRWLLSSISNEFKLQRTVTSNMVNSIRSQILKTQVQDEPISHSRRPRTVHFTITTKWDPRLFVQEQIRGLEERVHLASETDDESIFYGANFISIPELGKTITITGEAVNAQAITCEGYLDLVWPETGIRILRILKERHNATETLPNNTQFSSKITKSGLTVEVIGEIHAVVETIEIIAWLTSALRSSPFDQEGIYSVRPGISIKKSQDYTNRNHIVVTRHYADLTHELEMIPHTDDQSPLTAGSCWYKMFHNPILVLDYPICRRNQNEKGLEISLDIMSALLRTHRWIMLNFKLYMKGFAAMVIPTGQAMSSLFWHYIYSKDGQYLGFEQDTVQHQLNIDPYTLRSHRHFVGWSSQSKSNAGIEWNFFEYNVQRSLLDQPRADIAVKGFTLSTGWSGYGASLGASATCTIGHKDAPLRIPFSGLGMIEKLREIRKQAVVLWDTPSKRGWLIDGVSALLHLIRATAADRWSDEFKDDFKLLPSDLVEPRSKYPKAAIDFFTKPKYQNLKVELEFSRHDENGKAVYMTIEDLTDYFFNVLIIAAEAQSKLWYREGYYTNLHYRKYLDGWDFCSLIQDRQEFLPASQALDCRTMPWVDFMRSKGINAVTLFGSGFGEIIEPVEDALCNDWRKLPEGHNYLAARYDTLERIIQRGGGDMKSVPIRLTDKLIWAHPSGTLKPCSCDGRKTASPPSQHHHHHHHHSVQVVLPALNKWWSWNKRIEHKVDFPPDSAVVFGRHKELFHWFHNDAGEPVEGTPPECVQSETPPIESRPVESRPIQTRPAPRRSILSVVRPVRRILSQITRPGLTSTISASNNSQSEVEHTPSYSSRTGYSEDIGPSRSAGGQGSAGARKG